MSDPDPKMAIEKDLKKDLIKQFGNRVIFDEPMAKHTSFRIGGPADVFVVPVDENELSDLIQRLKSAGVPYVVTGKGTNLLVKDGGIRGVVVSLVGGFNTISSADEGKGHARVTAKAGARLAGLCRYALENNLSGMNFALGIPGTVGGAILMNAGAAGGSIADVIDQINVMTSDGKLRTVRKPSIQWSYRNCLIHDEKGRVTKNVIILSGDFLLKHMDRIFLRSEARSIIKKRKLDQPVQSPSAGCFFKNPVKGDPAGKLIDMAGLKGFRIGGAEVSGKHANFIINRGSATAEEILQVADKVQDVVFKKFQIKLEPEVKILGE